MSELPYTYFVSYSHGAGFGSMEVHCDRPVNQWSDIEGFARLVGARIWTKPDQIVVLNFQLLSGPTQPPGAEKALQDIASMVDQFDTPRDAGRVRAFVGDVGQVARKGLGESR